MPGINISKRGSKVHEHHEKESSIDPSSTTSSLLHHTMKLEIQGDFLKRGSEAYEKARQSNFCVNAHSRDNTSPTCIVKPKTVADVQAAIKYANEQNLTVTVRSGGHNWFGSFLRQDTLLIDMSYFNGMEINEGQQIATAGPCCRGISLITALEEKGLFFPVGHAYGVCIGGYLMGGGLGWFHEFYGFAAESVIGVDIVTPAGDLVQASDNTNTDWMTLFRGAASAFPGVVVSMKLKLHRHPPIMRNQMSFFPISEYVNLSTFLQQGRVDGSLPKNIEIATILTETPPPLKEVIPNNPDRVCMVMMNVVADSEDEFQALTKPWREMTMAKPCLPFDEFKDCTAAALMEGFKAMHPDNNYWYSRNYGVDIEKSIDFNALCEAYKKVPVDDPTISGPLAVGISSRRPRTKNAVSSYKGLLIMVDCRYPKKECKSALQDYLNEIEPIGESIVDQYNPLEHPVNKNTFHKCYEDATELLEMRNKLDPEGRFFDPSQAEPSH